MKLLNMFFFLTQEMFDKIVLTEVYNTMKNARKEYYIYLKSFVSEKEHSSSNYIMFNNGVYDLNTNLLLPFSENFIISAKIRHNYRKEGFSKEAIETAEKLISTWACGDTEIIQLLYEVIGSILYRETSVGKTFFLQGTGGNGKSTFFDFLEFIISRENIAYRDFHDFEKEYNIIAIKGKMLLVCDDIDNKYIEKPGTLKKIVTGEPIVGKALYSDPEEFRYNGKLLFAGNDIPRMNDTSNGLGRRLVIIPFKADLTKNKPDLTKEQIFTDEVAEYVLFIPRMNDTSNGLGRRLVIIPFKADLTKNKPDLTKEQIFTDEVAEYVLFKPRMNDTSNGLGRRLVIIPFKADLTKNKPDLTKEQIFTDEVAEYVLFKSIESLKNMLKNGDFVKSEAVDVALKEYHSYNNPIIEFIEEHQEIINTKACSVVYATYQNFCTETGVKALGRNTFIKKMEEQGWKKTVIKKDGVATRAFVPFG